MGILAWIVFGGLAGLVAGLLIGGRGGIIYSIIVGIVGALLGGFIMSLFGESGVTGWNWRSFGVAVLGAIVLLVILRLVRGGGRARAASVPLPRRSAMPRATVNESAMAVADRRVIVIASRVRRAVGNGHHLLGR